MLSLLLVCALVWAVEAVAALARKRVDQRFRNQQFHDKGLLLSQLIRLIGSFGLLALLHGLGWIRQDWLRFGDLSARAAPVGFLGIPPGEDWLSVAKGFLVSISVVTFLALYLPNRGTLRWDASLLRMLPALLLLSLVNAVTEEIAFRVIPLGIGGLDASTLALVSGIAFGLPHFFGYPRGLPGVVLASFLGWFLAKSVLETRGVFLAFLFHWVQDVLIMGILMASTAKSPFRAQEPGERRALLLRAVVLTITMLLLSQLALALATVRENQGNWIRAARDSALHRSRQ